MDPRAKTLPKSAAYHTQKGFVDSLPQVIEDTNLSRAVFTVQRKRNPLDVSPAEIHPDVKLEVFHHAVTNEVANAANDDSDNDEGQETTAVVTRRLLIENEKKNEKMVLHVPDRDSKNLTTLTVKFNPDGSVNVRKKDVPMSEVTRDLLLADGRKQVGVVVEATSTTNETGGRYLAFGLNEMGQSLPPKSKHEASSSSEAVLDIKSTSGKATDTFMPLPAIQSNLNQTKLEGDQKQSDSADAEKFTIFKTEFEKSLQWRMSSRSQMKALLDNGVIKSMADVKHFAKFHPNSKSAEIINKLKL